MADNKINLIEMLFDIFENETYIIMEEENDTTTIR